MKRVLNVCAKHPWDDKRVYDSISKVLRNYGHEVHNTAPNCETKYTDDQIYIHSFLQKQGMPGRIRSLFRLYKIIVEVKPQVMIAHEPDALLVAFIYSKRNKIPLIFDCHEAYEYWYEGIGIKGIIAKIVNSLVSSVINYLVKRIYAVTSVNRTMTERYKKFNINSHFLPNLFSPMMQFKPVPKHPSSELVFFGQFGRSKQVEMFIRAAEIMRNKGERGKIIVIGGGRNIQIENSLFYNEIKERALEDYFEFLPWMPREKAFEILNTFSVGLLRFDSYTMPHNYALPNKIFEYMALGLCVVGCELNIEIAAILRSEKCGILIPSEDGEALYEAWRYAAKNPDEVREMGAQGKRAIAEKYNWDVFGAVLHKLIEEA